MLVGRIIVQKSGSSAEIIQSAFSVSFASAASQVHNDLGSLQGGTADEYYHLTSAEYTKLQRAHVTKTSAYTATTSDRIIFIDTSLGAVDITLPSAASASGINYKIKLIDATNTGRIVGTIDGNTNYTLFLNESFTVYSDGTSWWAL